MLLACYPMSKPTKKKDQNQDRLVNLCHERILTQIAENSPSSKLPFTREARAKVGDESASL